MVCLRNISSLLLALAAVPSVMATPVANNEVRQLSELLSPVLGGDSSSAAGRSGSGSSSASPSAAPSVTSSPSPSSSPANIPSATPSATPSSPSATPGPSTSNSPTQGPTSTPQNRPTTTSPAQTSNSPSPTPAIIQSTVIGSAGSASVVLQLVTVITSNGQQFTATATSVAPAATSAAAASAKQDDGSPNTGKIVGIVVGTVGGVVLIAALAAVAWRIWGKNRHQREEDDALMDDGVYGTSEVKAHSGPSGASPFQNNLEQYHTPGKANPSANF